MNLPRITDSFECVDDCPLCAGCGAVCEAHPEKAWDDGDACCGAPGAPCPHVGCKFADAATVDYGSSEMAAQNRAAVVWPCGLAVEIGPPRRMLLPELRVLHREALLASMQVNLENDRTDVSFHVNHPD